MRRQKPLPKELNFKEFSDNRSNKTRVRTKKSRFQIKDDNVGSSVRNLVKKSSLRYGDRKILKESSSNEQINSKNSSYSRRSINFRSGVVKHDRRSSRGKSFKENRRESKNSWDSIPKKRRGDERRSRGSKKIELFDAVCKKCGKDCKVPFKPQMSKGVSCRDCFQKNATDNYRRSSGSRFSQKCESFSKGSNQRFARTSGGVRELFDAVCMKCKKPCKVPFKPTGKMGVSCSNCFVKNERPSDRRKSGGRTSFGRGRPSNRFKR